MLAQFRAAIIIFALLSVVTGLIYPLFVTAVGHLVFPHEAEGSLIVENDQIIGSELIGQPFDNQQYFWGRPSATSAAPYDAGASGGSNLGPTNPALRDAVRGRVETIRKAHPDQAGPVPVDLVTASGSGLDPHISPAAARYQVARVAGARGRSLEDVRGLVDSHVEGRTWGLLGEPRINVLKLNRALDERKLQMN